MSDGVKLKAQVAEVDNHKAFASSLALAWLLVLPWAGLDWLAVGSIAVEHSVVVQALQLSNLASTTVAGLDLFECAGRMLRMLCACWWCCVEDCAADLMS